MKIGILFTWAKKRLPDYVTLLSQELGIGLEPATDGRRTFVVLTDEFTASETEVACELAKRVRSKLAVPDGGVEWPLYVWEKSGSLPISFEEFLMRENHRLAAENEALKKRPHPRTWAEADDEALFGDGHLSNIR